LSNQRLLFSTGRANAAVKCGVVALGAGLLSVTAMSGAHAAAPAHGTVTGTGVNVRSSPSLQGAIVGHKNKGDHVAVYCSFRSSDGIVWDEIQVSSQWIAAAYVHVDSGTVPVCDGLGSSPLRSRPVQQ
jgi:uncharacterized protein YraI